MTRASILSFCSHSGACLLLRFWAMNIGLGRIQRPALCLIASHCVVEAVETGRQYLHPVRTIYASKPMSIIRQFYGHAPALLTDLYQLTMACAHWHNATGEREAVFHLFFRQA